MRDKGPEDKSWKLGSKWRCSLKEEWGHLPCVTGVKAGRAHTHGTAAKLEMVYRLVLL